MVFEHIEKVKQEYTDKYVVVDGARPELARFKDQVGHVKTVNMSGRALVEFIDYHLNIGWYDIDLDYLKVVDKPLPQEKKPAAKPAPANKAAAKPAAAAGEKKLSPLEMARMQGAAKGKAADSAGKAPAGKAPAGKKSTADILAMARGDKPAGGAPAAKDDKPAAGKPSTADILAMARGSKAAASSPPAEEAPAEDTAPEQVTEESLQLEAAPAAAEKVDKSSMSIEQMVAWCREHDNS